MKVTPRQVFGQVTVLREVGSYTEPSGHCRRKFLVRCSCGAEYATPSSYLLRVENPRCRKCVNDEKRVVRIGGSFDLLTIIGFESLRGRQMAVCQCACGTTIKIRPDLLSRNQTNNCGCSPRGKWRGVGQLSLTYFNRTKRGAEVRGLPFTVDMTYLWNLYQRQEQQCVLTGLPIPFNRKRLDECVASLDRIDSTLGYVVGNVQWVHKDVNRMKGDLAQDRFEEICALVARRTAPRSRRKAGQALLDSADAEGC